MTSAPRGKAGRSALLAALVAVVSTASCGPRVEYRVRPGFATREDLPDEVVLDDGTVIRYLELDEYLARKGALPQRTTPAAAAAAAAESFVPWEETDDGRVQMQADRNELVIMLAMRAMREERYGELWDQLVSRGVRDRAAAEGGGAQDAREKFIEWCAKWRGDAMTLLNRMSFAFSSNTVVIDRIGPGLIRLRLPPQVSKEFKFKSVEIYSERTPKGERMYLGGIR